MKVKKKVKKEKNSLWKNIREKAAYNKRTGKKPKKPTAAMLAQEKKIRMKSKIGTKTKKPKKMIKPMAKSKSPKKEVKKPKKSTKKLSLGAKALL